MEEEEEIDVVGVASSTVLPYDERKVNNPSCQKKNTHTHNVHASNLYLSMMNVGQ